MTSQLILVLVLNIGDIKIALNPDAAPKHVGQIRKLVEQNAYDGITFHRVIDGFVAQVGDVQYSHHTSFNASMVGTGGSDLPNIPAEFSVYRMSEEQYQWRDLTTQTQQTANSLSV